MLYTASSQVFFKFLFYFILFYFILFYFILFFETVPLVKFIYVSDKRGNLFPHCFCCLNIEST